MLDKHNLSEREYRIYKYICNYTDKNGYPPSLREICSAVGIKSPSTISKYLYQLEEKNLIVRNPNKFRGISLTRTRAEKKIPLFDCRTMDCIGSVNLRHRALQYAGGRALLVTSEDEQPDKPDLKIKLLKSSTH